MKTAVRKTEQQEAIDHLRKILKPGDTVYTMLNHVSRSGMSRSIDVILIRKNQPLNITWYVGKVLDYTQDTKHNNGLRVGGCGMDMGFSVVYNLSATLYGRDHGYKCKGEGCQSNFHQGEHYRDYTSEPIHHDGYALNHKWL